MPHANSVEFEVLRNFIEVNSPLSFELIKELRRLAMTRLVTKGFYLCREGEKCEFIAFVLEGLFKVSSYTEDGEIIIRDFVTQGALVTDYFAIRGDTNASCTIQSMERGRIIFFRADQLLPFLDSTSESLRLTRVLLEQMSARLAEREFQLLSLSGKDRYRYFSEHFGHIADRIPKQDIARYLGITPVSLSRILGQATASAEVEVKQSS